jgi:hypothetical protein
MEKKNRLVSIGYNGIMKCYLNISDRESIQRYINSENISETQFELDNDIKFHVIEFDDEFSVCSMSKIT